MKQLMNKVFGGLGMIMVQLFMMAAPVFATDYTSTNFIVRDPVMSIEGGESTSTSFRVVSSVGQTSIGLNSSSTFDSRLGFMYFATSTTPVVSATAGNTEVALSWTAATGTNGNVTGYEVGIATTSGGTYTFVNVGNVLTYTATGLTNGATHFFVVRPLAGTLPLTISSEVSATPANPNAPGSGPGVTSPPAAAQTTIILSGKAFPSAEVSILADGVFIGSARANNDASFTAELFNQSAGTRMLSLYAKDLFGRRSITMSFPVTTILGQTTTVGGILIPPTIGIDKLEVKRGESVLIAGQAVPNARVFVHIYHDDDTQDVPLTADDTGSYSFSLDSTPFVEGDYTINAHEIVDGITSDKSVMLFFQIGKQTVPVPPEEVTGCPSKGDLNKDCRVNIVDFSIAAFWYKRELSGELKELELTKLNGDGTIDIVDFSIMAYFWTG